MNTIKTLTYLGLLACILSSCSITKCRYSNGFNVDLGLGKKQDKIALSKQKQLKLKSPITLGEKAEIVNSSIENNYQITPIDVCFLDTQYHIIHDANTLKQTTFIHKRTQKFAQKIVQNRLNKSETKKHNKPTKKSDFLIELLKIFIFLLAFLVWLGLIILATLFFVTAFMVRPILSIVLYLLSIVLLTGLLYALAQYFGYEWLFQSGYSRGYGGGGLLVALAIFITWLF
ncbi:MAG: hypothetical protein Q8K70_04445 [Bacteroidota bacterium]|nr:hypothetical protein [Bacteroidota bacterium]